MPGASFEITKYEIFDDFAEMVPVFGQGCNYPTGNGVNGYHVTAQVDVTHGGEARSFTLVLQSEERTDNIQAYSGYEMFWGGHYGCDADEHYKLRDWLEGENNALLDAIERELVSRAEADCKHWLEQKEFDTQAGE